MRQHYFDSHPQQKNCRKEVHCFLVQCTPVTGRSGWGQWGPARRVLPGHPLTCDPVHGPPALHVQWLSHSASYPIALRRCTYDQDICQNRVHDSMCVCTTGEHKTEQCDMV